MTERIPSPDLTGEELELAEALKRNPEDGETKVRLARWTIRQEEWANERNTSRANIEVNLRRARLYREAGLHREAWEVLEDVRQQAHNENETDLFEAAEMLMSEIENDGAD